MTVLSFEIAISTCVILVVFYVKFVFDTKLKFAKIDVDLGVTAFWSEDDPRVLILSNTIYTSSLFKTE